MRNIITLLLAAPILFGCLSSEKSDETGTDSSFAGTVSGNSAPTISGNPIPAVLYGQSYDFRPGAADADGDILTFSIQGKPQWAAFDHSTGRLSGNPTLGDVGIYENIVISVSDGNSSASLPAYSVTVSQTALGSVTLNWVAPTQNSDGSALTDLAGFRIYYGTTSGNYNRQISIDNPSISTFVVEQLTQATYFFVATSFNSSGVESSYSREVARTVN